MNGSAIFEFGVSGWQHRKKTKSEAAAKFHWQRNRRCYQSFGQQNFSLASFCKNRHLASKLLIRELKIPSPNSTISGFHFMFHVVLEFFIWHLRLSSSSPLLSFFRSFVPKAAFSDLHFTRTEGRVSNFGRRSDPGLVSAENWPGLSFAWPPDLPRCCRPSEFEPRLLYPETCEGRDKNARLLLRSFLALFFCKLRRELSPSDQRDLPTFARGAVSSSERWLTSAVVRMHDSVASRSAGHRANCRQTRASPELTCDLGSCLHSLAASFFVSGGSRWILARSLIRLKSGFPGILPLPPAASI